MAGVCNYVCQNKTEYGYCKSTVCTNTTVINQLNNAGVNTSFSYGPDSKCYRVPCTTCGGSGVIVTNQVSTSMVESRVVCPTCQGTGAIMHVDTDTNELKPCPFCESTDIRYSLKAKGHFYVRYHASMYCNKCHCYGPRILTKSVRNNDYDGRNHIEADESIRMQAENAWNGWSRTK